MEEIGKILVIVGPNSSGKSAVTSSITKSEYNFRSINTKVIEAQAMTLHENLFFRNTIKDASKYLNTKIANIRELLYLRHNVVKDKKFIALTDHLENHSDSGLYYDILYNSYFKETLNVLSKGHNCIIDHNIFLSSDGLDKFFNIFSKLKHLIKIVEIFAPLQRYYTNLMNRNAKFYRFADKYKDGKQLMKDIKEYDKSIGKADLIFRRPLRSFEIWNSHFNISTTKKNNNLLLQKIKGKLLKEIIKSLVNEHDKLIQYIKLKNIPVSFSLREESASSQVNSFLNISDHADIFITKNTTVKNDYLLNTGQINNIEIFCNDNLLTKLIENIFPDLIEKNVFYIN